ncbi:MAG: MFS transporter [Actinomycetota bacterium]|nr:MFS transporter [Actinomycetota bacterium]
MSEHAPMPAGRRGQTLVLVGIIALAFNLRPAAVSVGPVLADIRADLGMSSTQAGILTTLPVLAFALFGALAPRIAHVVGLHRTSFLALLSMVLGLAARSRVSQVWLFLALTVLSLAGAATANVLMPSLVKLHFPDRIGPLSSIYTTALSVGLFLSASLTVPISDALGSWRWGLASWAVVAALAAVPWVALVARDQSLATGRRTVSLGQVARTPLGWWMAMCFGLQSLQAYAVFGWFAQVYRDAGFSPTTAGLLLGTVTGVSIPVSFWVPTYAAKLRNQTWLFMALLAADAIGYAGLVVAPHAGAWVWAALVGAGTGVFPLVLTLIGLRSRTEGGTAALSGFTQSVGYLVSAVGPFGMGYLYGRTGGWSVPLLSLLALLGPLALTCVFVSRTSFVEDQIAKRSRALAHRQ